jgi:succinoglycan biosynthesis protein ExoM
LADFAALHPPYNPTEPFSNKFSPSSAVNGRDGIDGVPPGDGVDICICTYRRHSVVATLGSIAALVPIDGLSLRVIVVDNDVTTSARATVLEASASLGLTCRYVHAPAHNISIARNAALDASEAHLVAFVDDDEIATPGWVAALIARQRETGAAIMLGPVNAVYGDGPTWLRLADLHSIRPVIRVGGVIATGYSSNVLLDRAAMTEAMRGLRFDPAFGRSGGEDTVYFNQLHRMGARIAYAEAAVVHEAVTPQRARLRWLLKRAFRAGQSHAWTLTGAGRGKPWMMTLAVAKCAFCAACAVGRAPSAAHWRRYAVRAALHAGVLSRLAGFAELELY